MVLSPLPKACFPLYSIYTRRERGGVFCGQKWHSEKNAVETVSLTTLGVFFFSFFDSSPRIDARFPLSSISQFVLGAKILLEINVSLKRNCYYILVKTHIGRLSSCHPSFETFHNDSKYVYTLAFTVKSIDCSVMYS